MIQNLRTALLAILLVACTGTAPVTEFQNVSATETHSSVSAPTAEPTQRESTKVAKPDASNAARVPATESEPDPTFGASPLALLDQLVGGPGVSVAGTAPGRWLHTKYFPALLRRVESQRPAGLVIARKSSIIARKRSTEGEQAMYMMECIRYGQFPLLLGSGSDPYSRDPEEYRRWWRTFQRIGAVELPRDERGDVDWVTFRPKDLIEALRRHAGSAAVLLVSPPFKWVTEADARDLMTRIRSRRPLACVIFHGHAPAQPPAQSDEGATARLLLHLYRESLDSSHAGLTTPADAKIESDPAAWEKWWRSVTKN